MAPPAVDKTYDRLINYVYGQYSESCPLSDPQAPPCCAFEDYFAISDPRVSSRPKLRVYPRVDELIVQSQDRADKLAKEAKPLQRLFPVADNPGFAIPRWLNPDFARLAGNKSIPKSRVGTMAFTDMEKVERCSRILLVGQSQSFWLLFALLSRLKQDGFQPSDPALFDKNISSLSATLAMQTSLAAGLTNFTVSKRRESYVGHVSIPLSEPQKRELLVTRGSDAALFDQLLLEKASGQVKEDSLISSSLSLAKLAKSRGRGRLSGSAAQGAGSSRCSSPLDFSRPGPLGYGKRAASLLAEAVPSVFAVAGACLLL